MASTQINKEWIKNGPDKEAIEWAKKLGNDLAFYSDTVKPLSTSQIRKFFGEIRRIQTDFQKKRYDLFLLGPKLAYQVGRDKSNEKKQEYKIEMFHAAVENCLKEIEEKNEKQFNNFVQLLEAIVAYHKEAEASKSK